MGKGDKKTKKGKRILSTWGVHRPKTSKVSVAPVAKKKKSAAKPKAKAAEKKTEDKEEVVAAKAAPAKKAAPKKAASEKGDNLTKIEGIGPKVMEVFNEAGIVSYADLAKEKAEKLAEILVAANSRYKMFDPTSWPIQAKMAADDKWDELKKWQDEHDGGKM